MNSIKIEETQPIKNISYLRLSVHNLKQTLTDVFDLIFILVNDDNQGQPTRLNLTAFLRNSYFSLKTHPFRPMAGKGCNAATVAAERVPIQTPPNR